MYDVYVNHGNGQGFSYIDTCHGAHLLAMQLCRQVGDVAIVCEEGSFGRNVIDVYYRNSGGVHGIYVEEDPCLEDWNDYDLLQAMELYPYLDRRLHFGAYGKAMSGLDYHLKSRGWISACRHGKSANIFGKRLHRAQRRMDKQLIRQEAA